ATPGAEGQADRDRSRTSAYSWREDPCCADPALVAPPGDPTPRAHAPDGSTWRPATHPAPSAPPGSRDRLPAPASAAGHARKGGHEPGGRPGPTIRWGWLSFPADPADLRTGYIRSRPRP